MTKKQQVMRGVHVHFAHEASIHQHIMTTQFFQVAASWKYPHPQEAGERERLCRSHRLPRKRFQGTIQLNVKE